MQFKAAFRVVIWVTLSMLLLCGTETGFTSKINGVFFKFYFLQTLYIGPGLRQAVQERKDQESGAALTCSRMG